MCSYRLPIRSMRRAERTPRRTAAQAMMRPAAAISCVLCCLLLPSTPAQSAPESTREPVADRTSVESAGNDIEAEMEASAQQLGEIEGRLTRLQQELSDRERQRDALYQELERNERDIAALARAGRQLTAMVDEQQRNVTDLEARLVETGEDLAVARNDLAELLRSAYAMGRGDRLRMLLNREDLTRSGRVFGYYRCLGRARAEHINEVEHLAAELARLGTEARNEARRLQRLAERQTETRLRLEAVQVERNAIVADLDANIAAGRGELVTLNANAQALRTLIDRLRRQVQIAAEIGINQEAIAARKGRLAWPISEARLASRFRGGEGDQDLHADGVLIEADEGSEVRAVHHGRVVYADWLRGFGLLLVIDHGDGYMTLYGHNQTLLKEVGEWIATGEVIALTGTSGGSSTRGLYFALRYQGKPLDPEHWCRGRG